MVPKLLSLVAVLAAVVFAYTGYHHSGPGGAPVSPDTLPVLGLFVGFITPFAGQILQIMDSSTLQTLGVRETGLLYPLGGLAVVFLAAAFVLFKMSAGGGAEDQGSIEDDFISEEAAAAAAARQSGKKTAAMRYKLDFDEKLGEFDDSGENPIFENTGKVIALSHTTLDAGKCTMVLQSLRPDLLQYTKIMSDLAREKIAKQILTHFILLQKRSEKDMSPDQFRLQDKRVNETIRETIARRFQPRQTAATAQLDAAMKEHFGRVFDLSEQPGLQQKTATAAEDWTDVSLRNAANTLADPKSGDGPWTDTRADPHH